MTTCRAAVFVGPEKPLEIQEFTIPEVEPGGVLVKMAMAAVCGSDVHGWHNPNSLYPVIWGHENLGYVDKLGKGLTEDILRHVLKEGDRILFRPPPCGICMNCVMGKGLSCSVRQNYGTMRPPQVRPEDLKGGFGEYLYIEPNARILRVPDDMSNERALLSVVGNHTVMNCLNHLGGIAPGDTVVVIGSGPIGMGGVTQARIAGAGRVIVTGAPANRLKLAKEIGADVTISIEEVREPAERVAKVLDLTDGRGADVVMECSGGETAFQEALEMARLGGKVANIGQLTDYGPKPINPSLITRKVLLISGARGGDFQYVIRSNLAMHSAVKAPVEKLITHQFALEDINEAFKQHETLAAMVAVVRHRE